MKQVITALLLGFLAMTAMALDKEPFSQARFAELQSQGEVVLIDVYADWCSTCKKQQEAISSYRKENPENRFHILAIDFDTQKDLVREFRAPRQSTLLLYRGEQQFWYSVAESRAEVIASELNKAFARK